MRLIAILAAVTAFPAAAAPVCFTTGGVTASVQAWPVAQPAAAGSWAPCPAPTVMPAQLAAAVAKAKGGDTILLTAGPPGPTLTFRSLTFSPPITITSVDPAHPVEVGGLSFSGVSGVNLVSLDIHRTDLLSADSPVLNIVSSANISVTNSKIRGGVDPASGLIWGKGVVITGGSNITVSGSTITDAFKGVSVADATDTIISGNEVYNIRTSPIDGGGLISRLKISANHIHGLVPVTAQGDHSDGIHIFTKSGSPVTGLTVSNNLLEQPGAAGTLGINLEGTPAPGGFYAAKIDGNTLRWNNNQALTTNYVYSGEFLNNVLRAAPGLDNAAHCCGLFLRNPGPALIITGNTLKANSYTAPYPNNTFLTPAQIAADGAN